MGSRRSGKSYTLGTIAEGLSSNNLSTGNVQNGVLILDTLNLYWPSENEVRGDAAENALKWGLDPESVSNMDVYYPISQKKDWMSERFHSFSLRSSDVGYHDLADLFKISIIEDPQGQLLSEVFQNVTSSGYNGSTSYVNANPNYEISDLIKCIDEGPATSEQSTKDALKRRLEALEREQLITANGNDIRDFFSANRVSDLLLGDLNQQDRGLVIGVIVKKIFQLRTETTAAEKRLKAPNVSEEDVQKIKDSIEHGIPRGWILIDEAHNFVPAQGLIGSSRALVQYVNEGRNIGLSLAVTTQNPAGLHQSIQRNADVLIVHKIGLKNDLKASEGMLRNAVPDYAEVTDVVNTKKIKSRVFESIVRELELGYGIISAENCNRIIHAHIRPRISEHGDLNY
jgi:DNA helicase HerA-like ATPase